MDLSPKLSSRAAAPPPPLPRNPHPRPKQVNEKLAPPALWSKTHDTVHLVWMAASIPAPAASASASSSRSLGLGKAGPGRRAVLTEGQPHPGGGVLAQGPQPYPRGPPVVAESTWPSPGMTPRRGLWYLHVVLLVYCI